MSNVHHPKHYNVGRFEVIDVIHDWNLGFNLGNTVKYIARAGHKSSSADLVIEDLEKALWYLNDEIARRKSAVPDDEPVLKAEPAAAHEPVEVHAPGPEEPAVSGEVTLYKVTLDDGLVTLLKRVCIYGEMPADRLSTVEQAGLAALEDLRLVRKAPYVQNEVTTWSVTDDGEAFLSDLSK